MSSSDDDWLTEALRPRAPSVAAATASGDEWFTDALRPRAPADAAARRRCVEASVADAAERRRVADAPTSTAAVDSADLQFGPSFDAKSWAEFAFDRPAPTDGPAEAEELPPIDRARLDRQFSELRALRSASRGLHSSAASSSHAPPA